MNPASLMSVLNIVTNAFLCLGYLAGIVVGILLITRKVKLPGILTVAGFALFGFNLVYGVVFNLVIVPQIFKTDVPYEVIYPVNGCLQGLIAFLGIAALIAAFVSGFILKKPVEGV